ncbi:hypothetical protein AGABI1DRAFT_95088 [Agaricus bisporus var. burnettii JB137-S8]|uniref:Uncharacterized protein n=1 Tax=Agaricus bisporus var. burnettii (strain JB137-S8 / ATCC MYA-4627 / FGSC 10392) TaxID=597362 RepID=K5XKX1_AGABU|nr:uncharacterized protein AGABI1DRAFT_95088 [Agaricus bisporus var. burnettii JB137-S8]EKM75135.1 hypothetical protein AGABI1DRAFT_95088 [Agaricus bisporus var. burnettii JB137-S8]
MSPRVTRSTAKNSLPSSSLDVNASTVATKRGRKNKAAQKTSPAGIKEPNVSLPASKKKKKTAQDRPLGIVEPAALTSPSTGLVEESNTTATMNIDKATAIGNHSIVGESLADGVWAVREQEWKESDPTPTNLPVAASTKKSTTSIKPSAASTKGSAPSTKNPKKPATSTTASTKGSSVKNPKKPAASTTASTKESAASAKKPVASASKAAASTKMATGKLAVGSDQSPAGPTKESPAISKRPSTLTSASSTSTASLSIASKQSPSTSAASASTPESGGPQDDELATLKATISRLTAEIDKAKKTEAAKPKTEATVLIPRPIGRFNLQTAMGLRGNGKLYSACRAAVNRAVIELRLPISVDWRKQDRWLLLSIIDLAHEGQEQLKKYEKGWATEEIVASICRNKRNYRSKVERGYIIKKEIDQDEADENLVKGINEGEVYDMGKGEKEDENGNENEEEPEEEDEEDEDEDEDGDEDKDEGDNDEEMEDVTFANNPGDEEESVVEDSINYFLCLLDDAKLRTVNLEMPLCTR